MLKSFTEKWISTVFGTDAHKLNARVLASWTIRNFWTKVVRKNAGMVAEESHAIEKASKAIDTVVEVKILNFESFFEGFEGIPQLNLQVIFEGILNEECFGTFGAICSKFIFLQNLCMA